MDTKPAEKNSHAFNFVNFVIKSLEDKGIAAKWRRADNSATEYQSWELLANFNIELDKDYIRLPYATVAAAIAKAKIAHNGTNGIGRVLASCYDDGKNNDQAKAKLRRLLACDSTEEVCRILRPIFGLMASRNQLNLDFALVLDGLLIFNYEKSRQNTKSRWAQDFYGGDKQSKEAQ